MDQFSDGSQDDEEECNFATLHSLGEELRKLLAVGSGRPASSDSVYVRRRVLRTGSHPGYAQQVASFFKRVISAVNAVHTLQLAPLRISHVLEHIPEGKALLEKSKTVKETELMAQAAVDIVNTAGRACRGTVVGLLATATAPNGKAGKNSVLSNKVVQNITKCSMSHINRSRAKVLRGEASTFTSQTKRNFEEVEKDKKKAEKDEEDPAEKVEEEVEKEGNCKKKKKKRKKKSASRIRRLNSMLRATGWQI
jgi:hypothetical protein